MSGAAATADVFAPGDVPTLVYMGDEELFIEDARQTAESIGARFEIIPGRGHSGAFQDLAVVEPIIRSFFEHIPRTTPAR